MYWLHMKHTHTRYTAASTDLQSCTFSFSPLAAHHVTAHACRPRHTHLYDSLQPQIDVTAGGRVINGAQELYHPEEIQPTARDGAAAGA